MSEQEIIEGNKLIAEFMDISWDTVNELCVSELMKYGHRNPDYLNNTIHWNCYHSSWDWLMPVVSKISKMYEDLYKQAFITKIPISYEIESTYADVICRHVTIEINHLFERVIEFIKWYNLCQKEK